MQRYATRLQEVMLIARSDKRSARHFGTGDLNVKRSALRSCPTPGRSRDRFNSGAAGRRSKRKSENPPVDPIFAAFIARVRELDDAVAASWVSAAVARESCKLAIEPTNGGEESQ